MPLAMVVTLSQYRGAVRGFNSQFVPNKQCNFLYSDSFRKLTMTAVSSVSFLISIYVFMNVLVPNGLSYMLLSRKNIKNINSLVSRRLYTLMLATYIRHIWVCSILITLSDDIKINPGPKPSSCDKFSICHWNLNSISAHNFIRNLSYVRMFPPIISIFYAYKKLIIQIFLVTTTI